MACVHIRVMADEHVSSADNHRWVAPSVVPAKTSKCIVSLCGVRGMAQLGARQKHAAHSLHGDPLSSLVLQCCCETDGQAERLETDAILEAGWDNAIMPGSKAVALHLLLLKSIPHTLARALKNSVQRRMVQQACFVEEWEMPWRGPWKLPSAIGAVMCQDGDGSELVSHSKISSNLDTDVGMEEEDNKDNQSSGVSHFKMIQTSLMFRPGSLSSTNLHCIWHAHVRHVRAPIQSRACQEHHSHLTASTQH